MAKMVKSGKKAIRVKKAAGHSKVKSPGFLNPAFIVAIVAIAGVVLYAGVSYKAKADKKAAEVKIAQEQQAAARATAEAIAAMPTATPVPPKKQVIAPQFAYLLKNVSKRESIPKIHIEEAKALMDSGRALFVDARGVGEYEQSHIKGAISMPAGITPEKIKEQEEALKGKVLITYCHGVGCHLSDKTAFSLYDAGYRKIAIFFGGWNEWTAANYPVEKYEPPEQYKPLFEEAVSGKEIREITLDEAKFLYDKNLANFVDVDYQDKYNEIRLERAVSFAIDKADQMLPGYGPFFSQKPVVLYCHGKGGKSRQVAEKLYAAGYKRLLLFIDAIPQWEKAGYPMYKKP
jgi:rhodanese-related sulfurtransferase